MSIKTGGSAYPVHTPAGGNCGPQTTYGMTLRQYYAGKAMQALIGRDNVSYYEIIESAFEFADGMIKESEKGGGDR